jgi:hypothetical protein
MIGYNNNSVRALKQELQNPLGNQKEGTMSLKME